MSENDKVRNKKIGQIGSDNASLPKTISCEVCLKEVPTSVAHSLEGGDSMINFCGIECHDKWIRQNKVNKN